MVATTLAVALKIELPGHTVRLCDGGAFVFNSEQYGSHDDLVGTIAQPEPWAEGVGDELPSTSITFAPPGDVAASTLTNGDWQGSRVRGWIIEINPDTGEVTGTAEQIGEAQVDTSTFKPRGARSLEFNLVSGAERLFLINEGNSLSHSFHQRIWPGETGMANAAGVESIFAWGVAAAPRGTAATASYGGLLSIANGMGLGSS